MRQEKDKSFEEYKQYHTEHITHVTNIIWYTINHSKKICPVIYFHETKFQL